MEDLWGEGEGYKREGGLVLWKWGWLVSAPIAIIDCTMSQVKTAQLTPRSELLIIQDRDRSGHSTWSYPSTPFLKTFYRLVFCLSLHSRIPGWLEISYIQTLVLLDLAASRLCRLLFYPEVKFSSRQMSSSRWLIILIITDEEIDYILTGTSDPLKNYKL